MLAKKLLVLDVETTGLDPERDRIFMIAVRDQTGVAELLETNGEGDAAEATFPEYVERPRPDADDVHITFSETAGRGFYEQIEDAIESGDEEPLIDFSRMPKNWSAPAARPRHEKH